MQHRTSLLLTACLFVSISAVTPALAEKEPDPENLAVQPHHLQWLDEVSYITTEQERDAFLALADTKLRDQFIEIFWKARDPTPGSTLNEFKEEHYRRIAHSNTFYGRETTRDGWKTDRGRIYILLGKPRSVSRFVGAAESYDSELWFYSGLEFPGVPPFLNLLFYRHDGIGEYKLYVPGVDKPTDLLAGNLQMNTLASAFQLLSTVDPELALASLSIRPGETGSVDPNRSSFDNMIVNKIVSIPQRTVDTSYVSRLAAGKAAVELEYTFSFTPMAGIARVFYHPGAGLLLDYGLEIQPQDLSLAQYENRIYTTFDILGSLKDAKERQIAPVDEQAELQLKPEELVKLQHRPMNFHSRIVAASGPLELSILLKSEATKQYARVDRKTQVEDPEKVAIWGSDPLFCYKIEEQSAVAEGLERPFQFSTFRVYPRVSSSFGADEKPRVYWQLYSSKLSAQDIRALQLRMEVIDPKTGSALRTSNASLAEARADDTGRLHAAPELGLEGLVSGQYELRCTLLDAAGKSRLIRKAGFSINPGQPTVPPWLLSRNLPAPRSSASVIQRARSALALDQTATAIQELEKLPIEEDPLAADVLLQAYVRAGQPQKVISKFSPLMAPVLYSQGRLSFQKALWCEALIEAHMKLGQWKEAQGYLERLLQDQPHRPDAWLKLANCQKKQGRTVQAQEALAKACALDEHAPECTAAP